MWSRSQVQFWHNDSTPADALGLANRVVDPLPIFQFFRMPWRKPLFVDTACQHQRAAGRAMGNGGHQRTLQYILHKDE